MASFLSEKGIVYWAARDCENGWLAIDCGCCGGIEWGGEEPIECSQCGGSGHIYWHKKSKVFARYPGGKFLGRGELTELELNGGSR